MYCSISDIHSPESFEIITTYDNSEIHSKRSRIIEPSYYFAVHIGLPSGKRILPAIELRMIAAAP
jgi:hypothetical protein